MSRPSVILAEPTSSGQPQGPGHRLAWLDVLRAVAALLVVHEHLAVVFFPGLHEGVLGRVLYGYAGVCLFFLISGYIIPASLERRGSLRDFWIGRIFRLYPLFLFALGALVALHGAGLRPIEAYAVDHKVTSVVAQITMIPRLLGVPETIGVAWTLAFEMAFYLLVAALFAVGVRRAEATIAWVLGGVALLVGVSMPVSILTDAIAGWQLVALAAALLGAALLSMMSGRRTLAIAGAAVGACLVMVLLATNLPPIHRLDGLLFLALMFTGTVIYRAQHGQAPWWLAIATAGFVGAIFVVQNVRYLADAGLPLRQHAPTMVVTVVVVGGLFTVGFALRGYAMPRPLAWLGLISYSVYLLHLVVLEVSRLALSRLGVDPSGLPWYLAGSLYVGLVAAVLGLSAVTYRLVERSGQLAGRQLALHLK